MIQLRLATITRPANPLSLLADPPAWSELAACDPTTSHLFFGEGRETDAERRLREQRAKTICARCPVQAECLTYAIDTRQHVGVWGGLDETEIRALIRAADRKDKTS